MTKAEVKQAMMNRLKLSGLDKTEVASMKLTCHLADDTPPGLPAQRAGFKIPYFTPEGKLTKFFRYRYLEYGNERGFAALVQEPKLLRYAQPKETQVEAYFPPTFNWTPHLKDATKALILTEGELKAACATKLGFPTVGLGGVWSWKSARDAQHIIPSLASIVWDGRLVYLAFDSDSTSNTQVLQAQNALCRELLKMGAAPSIIRIPPDGEEKVGLDDYLVKHGVEKFLTKLVSKADTYEAARILFDLNEEVLVVSDPGLILNIHTHQKMNTHTFVDITYADRVYYETKASDKGVSMIEKSAAREWLKWPGRARVEQITYSPGRPQYFNNYYNSWKGWGCAPVKGDVGPWMQLLDHLFDKEVEEREWFEQWLAYPIQNPGEKMFSTAVMTGLTHGTGKSWIGYTMFKIYGSNATEIGDRELYSVHNEWAENKQFIMADEIVSGENRRVNADRMKSMITQTQLRLNPKYIASYTIPDCINYYFTSNHPDAFFLEDSDRRFFIHEVKRPPRERAFYKAYEKWYLGSGPSHLFYRLQGLAMRTFDPKGHALTTRSKQEMTEFSKSDVAGWLQELRNPVFRMFVAGREVAYNLFSTQEILNMYTVSRDNNKITVIGMSREMKKAGFQKVYQSMPVPGLNLKLWAVRNVDSVMEMGGRALRELYNKERGIEGMAEVKF